MTTPEARAHTSAVGAPLSLGRNLRLSWQLVLRNIAFQRAAWIAFATAFVEPALYLVVAIYGISRVVADVDPHQYLTYVGPALVAVSVMSGSLVECTNNVFYRLRLGRLYDSIVCTTMSPANVAVAEMLYGTIRGVVYGAGFLVLLLITETLTLPGALLCLAAALPIAWMFSACGLVITAHLTHIRQLEVVQFGVFAMFLLAGTFLDAGRDLAALDAFILVLPLTHANDLMRALAVTELDDVWAPVLVVLGLAAAATAAAIRAFNRELSK